MDGAVGVYSANRVYGADTVKRDDNCYSNSIFKTDCDNRADWEYGADEVRTCFPRTVNNENHSTTTNNLYFS